jgi:hypothetical protein
MSSWLVGFPPFAKIMAASIAQAALRRFAQKNHGSDGPFG